MRSMSPTPDPRRDDDGAEPDDTPTVVARTRYVRSGWGVLAGVGLLAGAVVVVTDFGAWDTGPFCAAVAAAEDADATSTDEGLGPHDPAALEQALDRLRSFEGTVPPWIEDDLAVVIEANAELVAEVGALGSDADPDEVAAVVERATTARGADVRAAGTELSRYAVDECDVLFVPLG